MSNYWTDRTEQEAKIQQMLAVIKVELEKELSEFIGQEINGNVLKTMYSKLLANTKRMENNWLQIENQISRL